MARFVFYDDKLINILLQNERPSGGAAVQAYGWVRGLSETGQDVHVLTNSHQKEVLKEDCKDIKLVPLYEKQKGIRWLRWVYYRLPYIYKKIKQIKPDYLYQGVPGWSSCLIGFICYLLNIRYVLRISNDFLLDDRFYTSYSKAHRYFQRLGFKMSYCILCQNDYQLGIIKNDFPNKKALKISNPIFIKSDDMVSDINSRQYIAWLGLYQYQKNLGLLYEIASQLENEKFVIAGKESSKVDEETLYYLDKLKQLPNVEFAGFLSRNQVLPFLAKAKFLLNTSRYEGFSNTFLEAMTVGTPIISSENVNPDAIITKDNLGLVYSDVADLKKQFLAVTPENYTRMSESTIDYVMKHHEYKTLAKNLVDFLNSN